MNSTNAWFKNNELILNSDKTNYMQFGRSTGLLNALPGNPYSNDIKQVDETKFLGITITSSMSWESHINSVANKIKPGIAILYKVRNLVDTTTLLQIYHAIIQSHINYGILIWGGAPQKYLEILLKLQKKAIRIIARKDRLTSCRPLFSKYRILTVTSLYILESTCYAKKPLHTTNPRGELCLKKVNDAHSYNTRNREDIFIPNSKKKPSTLQRSCVIYNKLPTEIKEIDNFKQFRSATKKFLLDSTLYKLNELN